MIHVNNSEIYKKRKAFRVASEYRRVLGRDLPNRIRMKKMLIKSYLHCSLRLTPSRHVALHLDRLLRILENNTTLIQFMHHAGDSH